MNAKGDANRSVRMTKQRLYQALITLLQQKSLRERNSTGNQRTVSRSGGAFD